MTRKEERKRENSLKLRECSPEEFQASISKDPADNFAKTFIAKANMQKQWHACFGAFDEDGSLMGAIITTISKRGIRVANLQLLHTFAGHRRKGVGRFLVEDSLVRARSLGAIYFRVSSEIGAVKFYESLGMHFWGSQKSGTLLSIFRIGGDTFLEGIYEVHDTIVNKAINRKGKGGCTTLYDLANSQIGSK